MPPRKRKAPSPIYHEFYKNPDDTVIIKSKDNIYLRANKTQLIRSSMLFSDLLDSSDLIISANDEQNPVTLDFSSKTIAAFLDVLSISGDHNLDIPYSTAKEVYKLSKFTMSDRAVDQTKKILLRSAKHHPLEEPWDLLLFASKHNDVPLGKSSFVLLNTNAVARMTTRNVIVFDGYYNHHDRTQVQRLIRQLRPSWQLALYYCTLEAGQIRRTEYDTHKGGLFIAEDWRGLGNSFNPEEFE